MKKTPAEAGKSSYDQIDPETLFGALGLEAVHRALDLGCGSGRYTLPLAHCLPARASVHGVDLWEEGVVALREAAARARLERVTASVGDLANLSGLPDDEADLVLMATVLHDLVARGDGAAAVAEAARVLRPGGALAVVEFEKTDSRPGPPPAIRMSSQEVDAAVRPAGFEPETRTGLGPNTYLALYRR